MVYGILHMVYINLRISHPGSKAQYKGIRARNGALWEPSVDVVVWGLIVVPFSNYSVFEYRMV